MPITLLPHCVSQPRLYGPLSIMKEIIQFATSCCYHFVIKVHNYCDLITWHTHTHPLASFTPSSRSIYWHLTFNWTLFSSTQHDLNLGRHSSYIVSLYMLHTCICLCGRYVCPLCAYPAVLRFALYLGQLYCWPHCPIFYVLRTFIISLNALGSQNQK